MSILKIFKNRKSKIENWKLKIKNWKLKIGNRKLKIDNWKSENENENCNWWLTWNSIFLDNPIIKNGIDTSIHLPTCQNPAR